MTDLTIITSSYNSSRHIIGYCNSINNQLLEDIDVLFIDANSTDSSVSDFSSYNFRDGINIKIYPQSERINVYEAWNIGLSASRTDYVMTLNTDDRLFPSAGITMLGHASKLQDADILYSRCLVTRDPDHRSFSGINDWPEYSHTTLLHGCLCGPFPLLKLVSVMQAGKFDPEYSISGDYEMWLRMSGLGYKFSKVKDVIGSYYINPKGISTDKSTFDEHLRQDLRIRALYQKIL